MLVGEEVVESARAEWIPNPPHLTHRLRIGEARNVEDHRAQVRIGPALLKLEALHVVVAVVQLEVLPVGATRAAVQFGVLDAPLVDDS